MDSGYWRNKKMNDVDLFIIYKHTRKPDGQWYRVVWLPRYNHGKMISRDEIFIKDSDLGDWRELKFSELTLV
jgi:hypothetical protein